MWFVFFSTSDVFKAEELLIEADVDCKIVPTPVQDKAYCGVCVETENEVAGSILSGLEYKLIK